MSEIRSDLIVRARDFTTITSDSSYASDSYFTNKASGSDSKIRSDFRHWTWAKNSYLKGLFLIVDMFGIYFQSDDENLEPTRDLTTKGLTSNVEEKSEERSEVDIRIHISKDNF